MAISHEQGVVGTVTMQTISPDIWTTRVSVRHWLMEWQLLRNNGWRGRNCKGWLINKLFPAIQGMVRDGRSHISPYLLIENPESTAKDTTLL